MPHRLDQVAVMRVNSSSCGICILVSGPMNLVHVAARAEIAAGASENDNLDVCFFFSCRKRSLNSAYDSNVRGFLRSGRSG